MYLMESCPTVRNILLLDSEGKRVAVKYYSEDWPTNNAKEAFEKAVFTKTQKTNARTEAEIAMFENSIVVYSANDIMIAQNVLVIIVSLFTNSSNRGCMMDEISWPFLLDHY
ncbi:hypothetical protein M0R45_037404 [Rubus argutus]|uniref:Coatomer subunit zeta n=1 Tax=Rubus argutus TaxID=59490 RepID=A0AAW1W1H5_RUBAR